MKHIIYIPGLGDGYNWVRKLGLRRWRNENVVVTHIQMRWSDQSETFEQKLGRIKKAIDAYPDSQTILVGESAGGAVAIVASDKFRDTVSQTFTLCGMNQGVGNVNPRLYEKNVAFRDAMVGADRVIPRLSDVQKQSINVIYSSYDYTVRPKNSLIPGVSTHDLKITGHMIAIGTVLYLKYRLITEHE